MTRVLRAMALLLVMASSLVVHAGIPKAYRDVARAKQIPADILYAVAVTESLYGYTDARSHKTLYGPWPWSLNISRSSHRFDSRAQAYPVLKDAVDQGYSVDAGIMQVNWRWHQQRFDSLWALLDPYNNLIAGADILLEQYNRSADWWVAVGAYHAPGKDKASLLRAEKYRLRVRKNWLLLTNARPLDQ